VACGEIRNLPLLGFSFDSCLLGRMSVNRGLDRSTCREDEDDDGVIIGEKFGPSISRLDLGK
jgi:hypothetical protein